MNHSSCVAFLEFFGFVHGCDASADDDDFSLVFPHKDASPLSRTYAFKDLGNDLFRHNHLDQASACYDKACRLLCVVMKDGSGLDFISISNLGISLCLNLAACAIKLHAFEGALILCSMVLNYFLRHAKALFRKAMALKSLSRVQEAYSTLEEAVLVEPQNKDILRELGDIKNLPVFNQNGKRLVEDSLDANKIREGKRLSSLLEHQEPIVSPNVAMVENCPPDKMCACHFDPLSKGRQNKKSISVTQSMDRMDLATSSDLSNNYCSDTGMNVDHSPCSNQNSSDQFLKFNKKGGGLSRLKIDANSYQKLLQGEEIQVHQHKPLTTMTVRVRKRLPRKEAQTGTPHVEISREAVVPPSYPPSCFSSSPLLETSNQNFDFVSTEWTELVAEEVIFQIDKKKRVNSDSSLISKISIDQFRFSAVRKHSSKLRCSKRDHFKGHSRKAQVVSNLKTSAVYMQHLAFVCRYTKTMAVIKRNKRKDSHLIHFDAHYHPPFKKRWLSFSVGSISKCNPVRWKSSSYGVSDGPRFVF